MKADTLKALEILIEAVEANTAALPLALEFARSAISAAESNPQPMTAADIGRIGGSKTSPAKLAASRANARKPRPNAQGKPKPRKAKVTA